MSLTPEQLTQYFRRIGFTGQPKADIATLQRLHALHPQSIPFENLSVLLEGGVCLEPEVVFNKLVKQGRGGYCFEHNQLFQRALETIGFQVQGLSARVVWMLPEALIQPRTHMILLVTIDDARYLADVGFGGLTLTAALELTSTQAQATPHESFKLEYCDNEYLLQAELGGNWQRLYRFTLIPSAHADYVMANWYVSTNPDSRFVNHLIACRAEAGGRHTLVDNSYQRYFRGKDKEEQHLKNRLALRNVLENELLIRLEDLAGIEEHLDRLTTGT